MRILADHNVEGQAVMLWDTLVTEEWADLLSLEIVMFADLGLAINSSDRTIWRFVQEERMFLLTSNRNMEGEDSLEQTLRQESSPTVLPVLTIGNLDRMNDRAYRERCATRIAEIIMDLDNYLGASRLFIP